MARPSIFLMLLVAMAAQAMAAHQRRLLKDCPDNCSACSSSTVCTQCDDGYKWVGDETKKCQPLPPDPRADQTTYLIDVPPRVQYLLKDGYCAEAAFQSVTLLNGQWIPQLWLRNDVAKRAVLTGDTIEEVHQNTAEMLQTLRVNFTAWEGKGWQEFQGWAKGFLVQGYPVVTVAYLPGEQDEGYDHAEPLIGVTTATPGSEYDPDDIFLFNTVMDRYNQPIRRLASEFHGNRDTCTAPDDVGGCIPDDIEAGYAITGATYDGIGPHVELRIPKHPEEPTVPGKNEAAPPQEWDGDAIVTDLTPGASYTLYKFTSLDGVPQTAADEIDPAKAAWSTKFVAQATNATIPVTFSSGSPAYFIAVEQ